MTQVEAALTALGVQASQIRKAGRKVAPALVSLKKSILPLSMHSSLPFLEDREREEREGGEKGGGRECPCHAGLSGKPWVVAEGEGRGDGAGQAGQTGGPAGGHAGGRFEESEE